MLSIMSQLLKLITDFQDANNLSKQETAAVLGIAPVTYYQLLDGKRPVIKKHLQYHVEALNKLGAVARKELIDARLADA
jgi:hypothetical protein